MPYSPETAAAQALHYQDPVDGALVPPIRPGTTFARDVDYALVAPGVSYARDQNPGFRPAEALLAHLEGGREALLFASGMAAATALVRTLAPGDRIAVPATMYYGIRRWMQRFCANWKLGLDTYVAGNAASLGSALHRGRTRLLWVETPCNPTWEVTDIAMAADWAHAAGACLVADSTVATPVHTRPLAFGADIVLHSATKYLNGHGDVVAGALVCREPDELWAKLRAERGEGGGIPGPFDAWLLLRGMRTLYLRVTRASASALRIATHLEHHPALVGVLYPGLPSHPGHSTAERQMQGGFSGMLSLRVRGGREAALAVAGRCRLFARATSLGGVESLIEHRASIEGADSPVPADLLRLSVGIESADDLVADLEQALSG